MEKEPTYPIPLKDLTPEELQALVLNLGEKPYSGEQLAAWLFRKGTTNFESMTNLSQKFRKTLEEIAVISPSLEIIDTLHAEDGTIKFLYQLPDGEKLESVLIPGDETYTLCLSSQVGCTIGCTFCRTGTMGFQRNLSQGEILNQIQEAQKYLGNSKKITNLVFMGMGEPLLNTQNVLKALNIITSPKFMAFSAKHVTLSTVGIIPELTYLSSQNLKIGITISLNSANQHLRAKLMPIAKIFPLDQLKEALKNFSLAPGRRITIAYVLLSGINDSQNDAKELSAFVTGLKVKINLIPFNPWEGVPFQTPSTEKILKFQEVLLKKNFTAIIRKSKGVTTGAACGLLATGKIKYPPHGTLTRS
ncbi:MAG: 23S rRNA (adenine(2503)-C(2))-methyltransferase RlmN [Deltaproteobacteria bacterium]|nr:23S rRNA (adenine(2503)-C(2))-methyltransferase RlmN [Deltaproteobacteria bacterium]